jgi:hypothetical protein
MNKYDIEITRHEYFPEHGKTEPTEVVHLQITASCDDIAYLCADALADSMMARCGTHHYSGFASPVEAAD